MEFTYQDICQGLIKYFIKVEGYKLYRSRINRDVIYFYSLKHEYNVLQISNKPVNFLKDEELNRLVNKMQTSSHHQPKVLSLVISDQETEILEVQPGYWELQTSSKNLKTKLEPLFAQINHLKIEANNQNQGFFKKTKSKTNDDETNQDWGNDSTNSLDITSLQQEWKSFMTRTSANRLILTWVFMVLFCFVPLSGIIVSLFFKLDAYEVNLGLRGLERLFTGATTYTLTIAGHQWWRIFTWGFAVPESGILVNALVLFLTSFALYNLTKFSETIIGILKSFLVFLVAYLLTGLFVTIMLPDTISGGILPVVGIGLGILLSGIGVDTSLKSRVIRQQKLIWPVIILLFFPLFNGGLIEYVPIIVGLAFGAGIMSFVPHSIKTNKTTLIIYGLILLVLIVLVIVFAFLPRYTPAIDSRIVYTLFLYVKHGFIPNLDYANTVVDKIGWSIQFQELPGWGIDIVSK